MTRTRAILAVLVALNVAILGCGGTASQQSNPSGTVEVKIAHLADLTGAVKDANRVQIAGMDIALDEINNAPNAKYKITIARQDTGADPARALAEMKDVASDESLVLQIGPPTSTEFFAAIPQAEKLKLPIYSMVAGGVVSGGFNQYVFRSSFPDSSAIPALVDYAKSKLKAKTLASVYQNDQDSPRSNGELMVKEAGAKGLTTSSYSFSVKDVDYSAQVTKMAAAKPDVIFLSVLPAQAGFVVKAIRGAGISSKIISTSSVFSGNLNQIYKDSGGAAEGVVVSSAFDPNSDRKMVKDYIAKFQQKYPGQSISFDVFGYDAIVIIANALSHVDGKVTRESLRKAFAKVKVDGLTGTGLSFPSGYGDVQRAGVNLQSFTSPGVLAQSPK